MRALTLIIAVATLALLVGWRAQARIPSKLAREARYVATHGGVLGSCHGCATVRMRRLARRLVTARFQPAGARAVRIALCVIAGESGFNPGAISRTGDYGLGQINRATWQRTFDWGRILDPVYNLDVVWALSRGGRVWHPWVVWQRGTCR